MKNVSIRLLGLLLALSWGSGRGIAQGQEAGSEGRRIVVDETGAFWDADTGERLTAEEAAAELARQSEAGTGSDTAEGGQDVGEQPSTDRSPEGSVEISEGAWGGFSEERSATTPTTSGRPTESPSRPPESPPSQEQVPGADDAEELLSQFLEGSLSEESLPDSLTSAEGPTAAPAAGSPSRTPPASRSVRSLLPPNSQAARLLQDSHYALGEARLVAGPNGRWLTFNEALHQHYREADLRALLRQYADARQALREGDEASLRRSLTAFLERLDRLNAGRAPDAMPDNGGLDLEALQKRLQAEGKEAARTDQEAAAPPSSERKLLWLLLAVGLVALALLGVALAWWQARRPRGPEGLQVRGKVLALMGPDAGKDWEVAGPRVVLGTGADCNVVLTDHTLAPAHAALTREPDGLHLTNLDPAHETRVNGRPITAALLRDEDMIEMGQTTLTFEQA